MNISTDNNLYYSPIIQHGNEQTSLNSYILASGSNIHAELEYLHVFRENYYNYYWIGTLPEETETASATEATSSASATE